MARLRLSARGSLRTAFLLTVTFSLLLVASFMFSQHEANLYVKQEKALSVPAPRCVDRLAVRFGRIEDIFCLILPEFLPQHKNPCFYDYDIKGQRILRCLPYFYIIGMDKSGTTDLHNRMAKHPDVRGNKGTLSKEVAYWTWSRYGAFTFDYKRRRLQFSDYLGYFNNTAEELGALNHSKIITGDATPMDLWDYRSWPLVPQNFNATETSTIVYTPHFLHYIHKGLVPKLILQFREPGQRLFSDYVFLNYGKSAVKFHRDVLKAIDMMTTCLKTHSKRHCFFSRQMYDTLPCRLQLGCYSVYVREWLSVFPRSAFHISTTSEYATNMTSVLDSVFKFLGLDHVSHWIMADIVHNKRKHVTKNKVGKQMAPTTFRVLRQFYKACNEDMARLLQDERFLWRDEYKEVDSNTNVGDS